MPKLSANDNNDKSEDNEDDEDSVDFDNNNGVRAFFDEEAEDEDDDDGVQQHFTEELIRRENMDDGMLEILREQDRNRLARALNFQGSVVDVARDFEATHQASENIGNAFDGAVEFPSNNLHSSDDDKYLFFFMVSCKKGKEWTITTHLRNKRISARRRRCPLGIGRVLTTQTKGFLCRSFE